MVLVDFDTAFQSLTGHVPFGWQRRLFDEWLSSGRLPPTVDIPTGLGKTAVMALWLLARAAGADLPRRLVYIVDRRAVVDQATRFAEQLRSNMPSEVATALDLAGPDSLPISTLRGSFTDNRQWLEDPVRPAIVVGTIDMMGSRLLFEGYGVSSGMRPYHAGFLGVDTLVLLDEAHLCPPFEALLRQIDEQRDGALGGKGNSASNTPPFRLVSLSATGRDSQQPTAVFRLTDEDQEEPLVRQRVTARKLLAVQEIADRSALADSLAEHALQLGTADSPSRVLVYCDFRTDAVKVKESIDKELKRRKRERKSTDEIRSELLVGARRVYERTGLERWLEQNGFLGDSDAPTAPTFLVATSAGEVGVDLDADHMVCDLVAYERMVQRLGRVNRRGGSERVATVDVFAVPPEPKKGASGGQKDAHAAELANYKRRLAALSQLRETGEDRHDASPSGIAQLKQDHPAVVHAATTSAVLHPALSRELLDAWSMTSFSEHAGRPELEPWLRGWEDQEEPQTAVVWREHLPCERRDNRLQLPAKLARDYFRLAPIHASERLEAPCSRVVDWLVRRAKSVSRRAGEDNPPVGIGALVLDHSGSCREYATTERLGQLSAADKKRWRETLLPGSILVVHRTLGGLRDGLLDDKQDAEPPCADASVTWGTDDDSDQQAPIPEFRVEDVTSSADDEGTVARIDIEGWKLVRTFDTQFNDAGVATRGLAVYKGTAAIDENSRSISEPQALADHARDAADRARAIANRLGLPSSEVEAITTAARLHDDGKAAARWQTAMNAPREGRPYAKTSGGGNWRLLEGYRHEFGSLLKAERENLPDPTRDLILHLIAAHHGGCRPLISYDGCEDGPPSRLSSSAGDAALRFERLQREYGPWGLAWREAILRAADHSVSKEWAELHRIKSNG